MLEGKADLVAWCRNHWADELADIGATWAHVSLNDSNKVKQASLKANMALAQDAGGDVMHHLLAAGVEQGNLEELNRKNRAQAQDVSRECMW